MPTHKPTELSRIKLKTWTPQPVPMMSEHSAHLTSLPIGFRTWLWRYTCLLLISMLWHRQAILESKGDKLSSSAEGFEPVKSQSPNRQPTECPLTNRLSTQYRNLENSVMVSWMNFMPDVTGYKYYHLWSIKWCKYVRVLRRVLCIHYAYDISKKVSKWSRTWSQSIHRSSSNTKTWMALWSFIENSSFPFCHAKSWHMRVSLKSEESLTSKACVTDMFWRKWSIYSRTAYDSLQQSQIMGHIIINKRHYGLSFLLMGLCVVFFFDKRCSNCSNWLSGSQCPN